MSCGKAASVKIVKYFKGHLGAVAIVAVLLVVQASCDLALPAYTADIVDVGIQQSGIEDGLPREMSQQTFDALCMMLPEGQEAQLREAYVQSDGLWRLSDDVAHNKQQCAELEQMVEYPLVCIYHAGQSGDFDVAGALSAYQAGTLSKQQVLQMAQQAYDQLDSMGSAIVGQQAIAAVRAEYDACGTDTSQIQLNYLLGVGARMLGVTLVGALAAAAVSFVASRTGAGIGRSLRERLFKQVVSFSNAEIQSFSAASLITRGTNDIQQIQMVCVIVLRMVLFAPILAIGGIVMALRTNSSMAWVIVLAVVLVVCIVMLLMAVAMPKFRIMQTLVDRVNLVAREIITGLPVIRAFNRQRHEEQRFDVANKDLKRTQLFTNRVMAFMQPSMMLVMNGTSALIVWVGASAIDAGTMQTGDMIAFITYSMVIVMSFFMLSMVAIILPRAEVAAARIDEVLACEPSIHDPEQPEDAMLAESGGAEIVFDDVSFSFAGSSKPVLRHISFTAAPGTTTAIIGPTGSGKSTVLQLVERAYDVTEGSVRIDGVDVRRLTQRKLHDTLGYVPQKSFLFSGTIASNIAYSDEDMPSECIWQAAEIAQARSFIEEREGGLESPVSQGGTDVSGGQRQRLAIARAVATGARAMLFDDSFSALDYATDAALRHALHERFSDTTVIIVAQRIATIRSADNIIVLDDGSIVGQGTHDQLLESCPTYREIASSQLSPQELGGGDAA